MLLLWFDGEEVEGEGGEVGSRRQERLVVQLHGGVYILSLIHI